MKVTDALIAEHAVFYALFDHLTERADAGVDLAPLVAMLQSALVPHARFENEQLFDTLESFVGPHGPLAVMRDEHDRIESSLEALISIEDRDAAAAALRDTIDLARDHFKKEERVLFPLAEQYLSADQLSAIGERWAASRAISVG